jgi:hypothetical protein
MRGRMLAAVTVGAFVAGLALMIPFEQTVTRIAGVACLFAFIACGVFLVADPEDLARGDEADDGE